MAYFALHKLRILPGELMRMTAEERAFIFAAIDLRVEAEKEEEKKLKSKARK